MYEGTAMSQQMRVLASKQTPEWYTPDQILIPVREFFGGLIHLDPASNNAAQSRVQAVNWFGPDRVNPENRDGLVVDWKAWNVFLNPPYCGRTAEWVLKAEREFKVGNAERIVLLVKSVPGYGWWEKLWRDYPVAMLRHRVRFINEKGEQNGEAKQGSTIALMAPRCDWPRFSGIFSKMGRVIFPDAF